jgi:hypothetical protein
MRAANILRLLFQGNLKEGIPISGIGEVASLVGAPRVWVPICDDGAVNSRPLLIFEGDRESPAGHLTVFVI